MNLMIGQDIRQLELDAQTVRKGLDVLKQDCKAWARERQENDLRNVFSHLRRLEFDVSMLQADCMSVSRIQRERGAWQVLDSLHLAFVTLNSLFMDLKKMKKELDEACVTSADVKRLEIDWGRLTKTVGQIEKHLGNGEELAKAKTVLVFRQGGGRDVWFSTAC
jgi:hypothetical protein